MCAELKRGKSYANSFSRLRGSAAELATAQSELVRTFSARARTPRRLVHAKQVLATLYRVARTKLTTGHCRSNRRRIFHKVL